MLPLIWFVVSIIALGWATYIFGPIGFGIAFSVALLVVLHSLIMTFTYGTKS